MIKILKIITDLRALYLEAANGPRQQLNQALFEAVYIDDHGDITEDVPSITLTALRALDAAALHRLENLPQGEVKKSMTTQFDPKPLTESKLVAGSSNLLVVELIEAYWNDPGHALRLERAYEQALKHHRTSPRVEPVLQHRVDLRLTREERASLVAAYLAGATSRALATEYAVSKFTVIELVRLAGHQPRRRGPVPRSPSA